MVLRSIQPLTFLMCWEETLGVIRLSHCMRKICPHPGWGLHRPCSRSPLESYLELRWILLIMLKSRLLKLMDLKIYCAFFYLNHWFVYTSVNHKATKYWWCHWHDKKFWRKVKLQIMVIDVPALPVCPFYMLWVLVVCCAILLLFFN